jgi:hypothetical protein
MQWMRDRDLLIEETLAFAQSIAAVSPVQIEHPTRVESPKTVAVPQVVKPKDKIFEREEILQRVADFEATQHKFQRERGRLFQENNGKGPLKVLLTPHGIC